MSPKVDSAFQDGSSESRDSLIEARLSLLRSLPKNLLCSLLEVLVALSGALKHEDYARLGPLLWDRCLNLAETKAVIHVSTSLAVASFIMTHRITGLFHMYAMRREGTRQVPGLFAGAAAKVISYHPIRMSVN